MTIVEQILANWFWILVVIAVAFITYKSRAYNKEQAKAEAMLPQMAELYRKDAVFLCKWADYNEDGEGNIQTLGIFTTAVKQGAKIIAPDGVLHSIIEIYPLNENWSFDENYKDPVLEISARKKANVIISHENWKFTGKSNFGNQEWRQFLQKIKDESVVVLKLQ